MSCCDSCRQSSQVLSWTQALLVFSITSDLFVCAVLGWKACVCVQSAYLGLDKLPLCYLIPVCVCSQHTLGWTSSLCVTSSLFVCAANKSEQFDMATSSFQQSNVTTFYLCNSEQALQFNKSRTTLFTNDVKLQAFGLKNGSFSGDGRFPAGIRLALMQ